MNDFSVHRIIGRGGFGEVYGCRKADTGKMYAMKCLDKKRIKMKQGETLALNERIMLSLVSTGVSQTPYKLLVFCLAVSYKSTGQRTESKRNASFRVSGPSLSALFIFSYRCFFFARTTLMRDPS